MENKIIKKVVVKNNDENPIPTEIIAESIIKISDAITKMKSTKLTDRVIYLLIKDSISGSNIGLRDIETVLNAAKDLSKNYIKKI